MATPKTGRPPGRPPGARNKRTLEVAEKLAKLGYDPIKAMVRQASDPECEPDIALQINRELASYLHSKPVRTVDVNHSSPQGQGIRFILERPRH